MRYLSLACVFLLCSACLLCSQTSSVPTIYQPLVPAATPPGGGAFTLTVNGTGFAPGASVLWNGAAKPTTFVSSSQLQAAIPAADIVHPGTITVRVVNPGAIVKSNLALFPVRLPSSSIQFQQSQYLRTFGGSVATGDFDRDGNLDVVVPNGNRRLTVLLSNGAGTLQRHRVSSNIGDAVTTGDFNEDGILDLATADLGAVSILLGEGGGSFQPHRDFPVNATPDSIAAGDFNEDGHLDVAVVNVSVPISTVSVLLGGGDGTLQFSAAYATGLEPDSVTVGDFNGDGHLDLAVAAFDNTAGNGISILLGNGDGTFQPRVDYATAKVAFYVAAADFNRDGKLDLVVTTSGSKGISLLLGNGDGTFQQHVDYVLGIGPWSLAIADFNGDGNLDVIVGPTELDASFKVLLGNGDGTFQPPVSAALDPSASVDIAVADFNNDGKIDFFAADGYVFLQP